MSDVKEVGNDVKLNPETNQFEVITSKNLPKRSWSMRKRVEGTYDFKFKFEDSTIYANYMPDGLWKEFLQIQKFVGQQNEEVQANLKRIQAARAFAAHAEDQSTSDGQPDILSLEEAAQLEEALTEELMKSVRQFNDLRRQIVESSVIGWSNAPEPFSREALEYLPLEIVTAFSDNISEASRLSQADARFLKRS